jgi:hypothetical protein
LHDPNEKPIVLHHYLQLYEKEDVGNPQSSKKTVVSEHYDEVVSPLYKEKVLARFK